MTRAAIPLRAPAMASGGQETTDLIKSPPELHRIAANTKKSMALFRSETESFFNFFPSLSRFLSAFLFVICFSVLIYFVISAICFCANHYMFLSQQAYAPLSMAVSAILTIQVWYSLLSRDYLLGGDRKSTRLNSSHVRISYAVFCL